MHSLIRAVCVRSRVVAHASSAYSSSSVCSRCSHTVGLSAHFSFLFCVHLPPPIVCAGCSSSHTRTHTTCVLYRLKLFWRVHTLNAILYTCVYGLCVCVCVCTFSLFFSLSLSLSLSSIQRNNPITAPRRAYYTVPLDAVLPSPISDASDSREHLHFQAGVCVAPHPDKVEKGGEDSFFIADRGTSTVLTVLCVECAACCVVHVCVWLVF
jgi:hypothetical protein